MKKVCASLCVLSISVMGVAFAAGLSQKDLKEVRSHIQPTYYQEYQYLHSALGIQRNTKISQEVMVVATTGQSSNIDLSAMVIQKATPQGFVFITIKNAQKVKDISVHKHGSVLDYWMNPFIGQFRAAGTYTIIKDDALIKQSAKRVGVAVDPFVAVRFTPQWLRYDLQLSPKEHNGNNMFSILYKKDSAGKWQVTTQQTKVLIPRS